MTEYPLSDKSISFQIKKIKNLKNFILTQNLVVLYWAHPEAGCGPQAAT